MCPSVCAARPVDRPRSHILNVEWREAGTDSALVEKDSAASRTFRAGKVEHPLASDQNVVFCEIAFRFGRRRNAIRMRERIRYDL